MTSTTQLLLAEIEAYLARSGETATKFGVATVRDGHLVSKLRKGASVTLKTADRVRAYMRRAGPVAEPAPAAPRSQPPARRIVLVIGGGIAAYKCLDLIRRLKERGIATRTVLTRAAQQFVTPLSVAALSNERVLTDLFDLDEEREIGHIRLSREADLVVVAPATADLLARMAGGHADDLATAMLLACDKPVLVAPAMNPRMWRHPATRRNVALLEGDGVHIVGPAVGEMAESGEAGPGRLVEVPELLAAIEGLLAGTAGAGDKPLAGRHVLVTSGPTHEPIDPVRYIANRSSGKQGAAIAAEAALLGARVTLVSGPTNLPDPRGVAVVHVESARQMLEAVSAHLPADIGIFAAAVADWRVATSASQKIKKGAKAAPRLELVENPDILKTIARSTDGRRPALVIGFAAETDDVIGYAQRKRISKGADWIVANDVSPHTGIMGGDRNSVHIITAEGVDTWPDLDKQEVARRLVRRAADELGLRVPVSAAP
ncbi:MAG: bifunctional phosphopantothenoylcysteine decarboxylase/phosphopantothenate--cysteine ligase CoaBC [Hyphomicrobiaceae bacterium]|nr:bifunctional phosphopantothenoylcysteine decarboxylase/phosphopantothenate--cysteine ligase CoaBC [Hyphomicrobiaceae bacterium]